MTLQRKWIPAIREAIARRLAEGRDGDYTVDGYTILVEKSEAKNEFRIGLYLPGSMPDGTCDGYFICTADGEAIP
jgi:hypothetical protein